MTARVLIHVQHLMGIGHQSRAALISRALAAAGAQVTYVSGGFPVPGLDVGDAELVQLPPARASDGRYRGLVNEALQPVDDAWRRTRRERLLQTLERCRPEVVVTETFPFGRRLLRFELLPLLERLALRHPRTRLVSSVRDILERRSRPEREQESVDLVRSRYCRVLVHSDPAVVPLGASFPLAKQIEERLAYTGYVAPAPVPMETECGRDEIVVSAGGGRVGEKLLRAAIGAHPISAHARRRWRILVGPDLPDSTLQELRRQATRKVRVERNRPDFPHLLSRCHVSISQAGYNTVADILRAGARAVLVPYAESGEREQSLRADLLAARGVAVVVEPDALGPESLACALEAAAALPRPLAEEVDLDGARRAVSLLLGIAEGRYDG